MILNNLVNLDGNICIVCLYYRYEIKNLFGDLEMTGLDPDVHQIVEIASLVTDGPLR